MKNKIFIRLLILAFTFSQLFAYSLGNSDSKSVQTSKIYTYIFDVESDSNNEPSNVKLRNIYKAEGKLKEDTSSTKKPHEGDLNFSLISTEGKEIKSYDVENPLVQELECPGSDHHNIKRVEMKVQKASFTIRSKKYEDVSDIKVYKVEKANIHRLINDISLNAVPVNSTNTTTSTSDTVTSDASTTILSPAPLFETIPIINNGPISDKINLVMMGDGYTSTEMDKFVNDATLIAQRILAKSPYKERATDFNVYAIKVISNVSGAAPDRSHLIDNYFGSTFYLDGVTQRLLGSTKTSLINDVLTTQFPQYDRGLLIVNSTVYGGSGGKYATSSMESSAPEIMIHELGHTWGLQDEYWWAGNELAPNCTQNSNPTTIKWNSFLGIDGVGIYQYESPGTGWFRPHQSCEMRYLGYEFCDVCKDAQNKKINALLGITPSPTSTIVPTSSQTPTPTIVPTSSPTPTPTSTPTATSTLIPTPKSTPKGNGHSHK